MLLDPRNGPAWDLAPTSAPRRTLFVASTPRTGSTLLCRLLWDTGFVGAPCEYLNPMQVRDWDLRFGSPIERLCASIARGPLLAGFGQHRDAKARSEHLSRVQARRTATNGWFSVKVHRHHAEVWFGPALADLSTLLPDVTVVRIRRDDRVAQAASWVRARRTGRFAADQRGYGLDRVDVRSVRDAMRQIDNDEVAWDRDLPVPVVDITFETLIADPAMEVRRLLRALDLHDDVRIGAPDRPPQSDEAWRIRVAQLRRQVS